jgi:hypothetical protein
MDELETGLIKKDEMESDSIEKKEKQDFTTVESVLAYISLIGTYATMFLILFVPKSSTPETDPTCTWLCKFNSRYNNWIVLIFLISLIMLSYFHMKAESIMAYNRKLANNNLIQ